MTKPQTKRATARPVAVPPSAPELQPWHIVGPDDTDELNPAILEQIEKGQQDAFQIAGQRLGERHGETIRRLVGMALFVLGLDPASEDEAIDVVEKILGTDDDVVHSVKNPLLQVAAAAHGVSIGTERKGRIAFLRARQADLKRLRDGNGAEFKREIGAPVRARLVAGG